MLACLSTKPMLERVSSCDWNLSSGGAFSPWLAMLLTMEFMRVLKASCPTDWLAAAADSADPAVVVVVALPDSPAAAVVVAAAGVPDAVPPPAAAAAFWELRAALTAGKPMAL